MRHLMSAILALILAPLIYVAAGFSAAKLAANGSGSLALGPTATGVLAALAAGALYAPLVMARLSPLGPVLGSLLFIGITAWALLDARGFHDTMPSRLFGVNEVFTMPVGAGTLLLAVPMLFTAFSPRRWRVEAPVETTAAPTTSLPAASGSLGYEAPIYQPPIYQPPSAAAVTPSFLEPKPRHAAEP